MTTMNQYYNEVRKEVYKKAQIAKKAERIKQYLSLSRLNMMYLEHNKPYPFADAVREMIN